MLRELIGRGPLNVQVNGVKDGADKREMMCSCSSSATVNNGEVSDAAT